MVAERPFLLRTFHGAHQIPEGGRRTQLVGVQLAARAPAQEQDAVLLGVLDAEADVGLAAGQEGVDGIVDAGGRLFDGPIQLGEASGTNLEDQCVLVGEVEVDRGRGHADGVGDGPDGDGFLVAGRCEEALGRGHQFVAQLAALSAPGPKALPPRSRRRHRFPAGIGSGGGNMPSLSTLSASWMP